MPQQAEAGDVGAGAHADGDGRVASRLVQRSHHVNRLVELGRGELVGLGGAGQHAAADRLGEHERVAGPGGGVGQDAIGMHAARDGQPVFDLRVAHAVSAGNHRAGLVHDVGAPAQDVRKPVVVDIAVGVAHQVEGRQRLAAHRVHVAERVGGGDAAEVVRVVHQRREEIGRQDEGRVLVETIHARVVERLRPDEQVGMPLRAEPAQHLRHAVLRQLAGSPGAVGVVRQSFLAAGGHVRSQLSVLSYPFSAISASSSQLAA